jgi:Flp pilus assembly pilin Flp
VCDPDLSPAGHLVNEDAKGSIMLARRVKRGDRAVERGATAVEYGLLVALIAGVIVVATIAFGEKVLALFTSVPSF